MNDLLSTLRDPHTIRLQAQRLLALAKNDKLTYFKVNPEQYEATAAFVIEVIKSQYPDFNIPYHSRWRHFEAGGINHLQHLQELIRQKSAQEQGKILYELVIISVLLDAGAGNDWVYLQAQTGKPFSRSEGLALASLAFYEQGAFSANPKDPLRVDAKALIAFSDAQLAKGFQVTSTNPLEGLTGRVALLNRLGMALQQNSLYFGQEARLGNFYTFILSCTTTNTLSALALFSAVLDAFQSIWPTKITLEGTSLGDVGLHPRLKTQLSGSEFIPFHKLSQWMTYSLIEPLEQQGIKVTDLDELTGLPEYRNGGLLIDMGLLSLKNPKELDYPQDPSHELIVEWRGLTVALLDELAVLIRQALDKDHLSLPLAKILQGGTWEAGRRIAKQKRSQGVPPIRIISDGSVF